MTSIPEPGLPRRFRQASATVLEIRDGGGIIMLAGLPLFLAGAFMLALFAGMLPMQPASGGKWTSPGFSLMGLAFVMVGIVLVFGRRWLILDVSRGLVVLQQGLLVPLHTRERSLSEFSGVAISRVRGDSESVDRYPVRLQARLGKHLTISRPSKFGEARQQAQYLSRWLRLPLTDETTDHVIVTAPEQASDSLQKRWQAEKAEAAAPPERPQRMRSQVEESRGEVKIVIPGGNNRTAVMVAAIFATVSLLVFFPLFRILPNGRGPALPLQVLLLIIAIFVVPIIMLLAGLTATRQKKTIVKASRAGLEIHSGTRFAVPVRTIPADEIVDLDFSTFEGALRALRRSEGPEAAKLEPRLKVWAFLAKRMPGDGIIVKSKKDWINFGERLPADELRYLAWLLKKTLGESRN